MKKQEIYKIVKNHLLKYGADEIADTIDIDEENVLQVINKIATNISNEISERESSTEQTNETDSKALHIADVVRSDSKEQLCIYCFNSPKNAGENFNQHLCDTCFFMNGGRQSNFRLKKS